MIPRLSPRSRTVLLLGGLLAQVVGLRRARERAQVAAGGAVLPFPGPWAAEVARGPWSD